MTQEEFAKQLQALLQEYTGRTWRNWVVFGQAHPSKPDDHDTIVVSDIIPQDLLKAFEETTEEVRKYVAQKELKEQKPTLQ